MNLIEIYNLIYSLAESKVGINSIYKTDPYNAWNTTETKYGSLCVFIETANLNETMITYNVNLYYGDRLTETGDNTFMVQTQAVNVLSSLITDLEHSTDLYGITYNSINLFKQKFVDFLGGAYTTLQISVARNNCIDMDK
jgi:hypothetical protein